MSVIMINLFSGPPFFRSAVVAAGEARALQLPSVVNDAGFSSPKFASFLELTNTRNGACARAIFVCAAAGNVHNNTAEQGEIRCDYVTAHDHKVLPLYVLNIFETRGRGRDVIVTCICRKLADSLDDEDGRQKHSPSGLHGRSESL